MTEGKVARAVGTISISSTDRLLAQRIQSAMSDTVLICSNHGVGVEEKNSPILQRAMQTARAAVKEGRDYHTAVLEVLGKH